MRSRLEFYFTVIDATMTSSSSGHNVVATDTLAPTVRCDDTKLPCTWNLYAHFPCDSNTYLHSYQHIMDFTHCEDWGVFQYVTSAGVLAEHAKAILVNGKQVSSFSLFRNFSRPEWEHSSNKRGYTLTYRLPTSPEETKRLWDTLVADAVRGAMSDDVMGVQITRKWYRFALQTCESTCG